MRRRGRPLVRLSAVAVVLAALACGKKGNPLPPLRSVPSRITDLTVLRTSDRVALQFTVPATNLDGTSPPAVERVDVFGLALPAGTRPPSAASVASDPDHRRAQLTVRKPEDTDSNNGKAASQGTGATERPQEPAAGDHVTVIDHIDAAEAAGDATIYYVVVPVAGRGRGRPGPPSPAAAVSLGSLPAPPGGLSVTYDEHQIAATWQAGGERERYRVLEIPQPSGASAGEAGAGEVLSAEPLATPEFRLPVTFGQRTCLAVASLDVTGVVTLEGPPSAAVCVAPVDHFAPPAPGGLQAVQDGSAITLIWNRVDVPDLAGYIVLRSDGATGDFQPLMRTPIQETTYRDTTVRPGATYGYAVYAVDTAPTPNVSQLSSRQVVTVR